MRFLFLAPRFHTNQVDLVRKLQEEGHHVSFLVALTSHSEDHTRLAPVLLAQTRVGEWLNRRLNQTGDVAARAAYTVPSIRELWARLEELQPDVVIVRSFPGVFIAMALPWVLVHRRRIVVYTQRPKYVAKQKLSARVRARVALGVLRIRWFTTVERLVKEAGSNHDVHPRISFIPFFKYPEPKAAARSYGKPVRFLAVAKFTRRKNLFALIEAFAALKSARGTTLTVVGENTRPEHAQVVAEIQEFVRERQLETRVILRQNLKYEEVQEQYLEADVFMMVSYGEPASVSQVEAMANAMAVVCNEDNGTAHYVDPERTGLLVASDVDSIAKAMQRYVDDPELAERHGRAGFDRIRGQYSVDNSYRRLLAVVGQWSWLDWRAAEER